MIKLHLLIVQIIFTINLFFVSVIYIQYFLFGIIIHISKIIFYILHFTLNYIQYIIRLCAVRIMNKYIPKNHKLNKYFIFIYKSYINKSEALGFDCDGYKPTFDKDIFNF